MNCLVKSVSWSIVEGFFIWQRKSLYPETFPEVKVWQLAPGFLKRVTFHKLLFVLFQRRALFGGEKVQLGTSVGLQDHFQRIHFFSLVVLIDRQTFWPCSARVQCGCLVNEVDLKDYNQRGDITDHMCQRRWPNLPGSWCQKNIFCALTGSYLP